MWEMPVRETCLPLYLHSKYRYEKFRYPHAKVCAVPGCRARIGGQQHQPFRGNRRINGAGAAPPRLGVDDAMYERGAPASF